jgi:hypothetical protein
MRQSKPTHGICISFLFLRLVTNSFPSHEAQIVITDADATARIESSLAWVANSCAMRPSTSWGIGKCAINVRLTYELRRTNADPRNPVRYKTDLITNLPVKSSGILLYTNLSSPLQLVWCIFAVEFVGLLVRIRYRAVGCASVEFPSEPAPCPSLDLTHIADEDHSEGTVIDQNHSFPNRSWWC